MSIMRQLLSVFAAVGYSARENAIRGAYIDSEREFREATEGGVDLTAVWGDKDRCKESGRCVLRGDTLLMLLDAPGNGGATHQSSRELSFTDGGQLRCGFGKLIHTETGKPVTSLDQIPRIPQIVAPR